MNKTLTSTTDIIDEIEEILKGMLAGDVSITARGVARSHSSINAASSITRNPERLALLEKYQGMQAEFRSWQNRLPKRPVKDLALKLTDSEEKIRSLEHKVSILTVSHAAMIRVIGEIGGFPKWVKLFEEYNDVREYLISMQAMPRNPTEVEFPAKKSKPTAEKVKRRKT